MKKFFPILVVLIICVVFGTFVACNNNEDPSNGQYSKVVLRSDMTLDEVKEALKDVKIFTMQTYSSEDVVAYEYTWAQNGYSCVLPERYYGAIFFEGSMYYEIFFEGETEDLEVVDCSGYDTTFSDSGNSDVEAYLGVLYELMSEYEYTIKDNVITVNMKDNEGNILGKYIAKNFNARDP